MSTDAIRVPGVPVGLKLERIDWLRNGMITANPYTGKVYVCEALTPVTPIYGPVFAIDNDYNVMDLETVKPLTKGLTRDGSLENAYRLVKAGEYFISPFDKLVCLASQDIPYKRIVVVPKTQRVLVIAIPIGNLTATEEADACGSVLDRFSQIGQITASQLVNAKPYKFRIEERPVNE